MAKQRLEGKIEWEAIVPNPFPDRTLREDLENCFYVLRNHGLRAMCTYERDATKHRWRELFLNLKTLGEYGHYKSHLLGHGI